MSNEQKTEKRVRKLKKKYFFGIWLKSRARVRIRNQLYGSADPDPQENIQDPGHRKASMNTQKISIFKQSLPVGKLTLVISPL